MSTPIPGSTDRAEYDRFLQDPLGHTKKLFQEHGPIFRTNLGVPAIFVVGSDVTKTILASHYELFGLKEGFSGTPLAALFEDSLFVMDHAQAKQERASFTAALNMLAMKSSFDDVCGIWRERTAQWAELSEHDIFDVVAEITFEVACRTILGLSKEHVEFARIHPLIVGLLDGARADKPGALERGLECRQQLLASMAPWIRAARSSNGTGVIVELAKHTTDDAAGDRHIANQLLVLIWASYDTSTATAAWLFKELVDAPDWQARVAEEVDGLPVPWTIAELQRAPLIRAAMKEAERLHPTGVFFPRVALADVEIGDHEIPAGTLLFYSAYLTNRDPEVFEEPDAFRPARWLDGSDPLTFSFGHGPRQCVGQPFAQMQSRIMLATVLSQYRISLHPSAKPHEVPLPVYYPVGLRLKFERRKQSA